MSGVYFKAIKHIIQIIEASAPRPFDKPSPQTPAKKKPLVNPPAVDENDVLKHIFRILWILGQNT